MKRLLQWTVAIILLGSLTIQADPFKTFDWISPSEYENNTAIPASDELSYRLKCGASIGGPYNLYETTMIEKPSLQDLGPLVANLPGTYYCVSTATSSLHNTESAASNEVNFTVLPSELGLRPKPPVLSLG